MVLTAVHGLPRIGARRELKTATEGYWAGEVSGRELRAAGAELRLRQWRSAARHGIDHIPSNTFSFYDHMLDAAVLTGALPGRFNHQEAVANAGDDPELERYFTAARGGRGAPPLEMTKWFDTNYHYLVPELEPDSRFSLHGRKPLDELAESRDAGVATRPVLVGPLTFLLLAKPAPGSPPGFHPVELLDRLLPVYAELLTGLRAAGAEWVQLDETALARDLGDDELAALERAYRVLGEVGDRPRLCVSVSFGPAGPALPVLRGLPVEGVGLDLCRGGEDLEQLRRLGRPLPGRTLFAGVVDGRNVWANDLTASLRLLEGLDGLADDVGVSTSCSLLHVPVDLELETDLDPEVRPWLAFAEQKLAEVATLGRGLRDGRESVASELAANAAALAARRASERVVDRAVRERVAALRPDDGHRPHAYDVRRAAQRERLHLPAFPTTTIGSFPQTPELRSSRAAHHRGDLSDADYANRIKEEIARVVALQEELRLDVLVHGEPERNDMVAYFAERLTGYAATTHGWVQSFGTRYVRPPILFGDVARPRPITVDWAVYAQSLTDRPVKGMLTGPVTMLLWSFVRDDQPAADTCRQLALAVRDEVVDLQDAGIGIIQVDEPALREGLPLRHANHKRYLDWATECFRIATAPARDDVQIHTHMCYADFDDILAAVDDLDADVISMEAARSSMTLPAQLAEYGYPRQVGPGVYDIHSPAVPTAEQMARLLTGAATALPADRLWANPDCGLKTRRYEEVVPALRNLVTAAGEARAAAGEPAAGEPAPGGSARNGPRPPG